MDWIDVLVPNWIIRRRVARMCKEAQEAEIEKAKWLRIKALPEREPADPLRWPLPVHDEPPCIYDEMACDATFGPLRCEKLGRHRTKAHAAALDVDDVLGERIATWKDTQQPVTPAQRRAYKQSLADVRKQAQR